MVSGQKTNLSGDVKVGGEGSGKAKGDLLVLDGHKVEDGKLSKTDFFNFLATDLSDYSNVKMTPKQAIKFKNTFIRITHGVGAAIPMLCTGPKCPNKICIFHETKNWPLSLQCPYEARMIQYLFQSYMEDLGVDPESPTELTLINELVEADVLSYRANLGLSGGIDEEAATLLKTSVIEKGDHLAETTVVHPLLEVKERCTRTRMRILESLAATRREKYKKAAALKKSEDSDASSFLADLREQFSTSPEKQIDSLDKIREDAKKVANDLILDADWEQ
jgi:hypothetical protein